jgi:hypothetical protein
MSWRDLDGRCLVLLTGTFFSLVSGGCRRRGGDALDCDLQARIQRIAASPESPMYAQVDITVANLGSAPCRVLRYMIAWSRGKATYEPDGFLIPPGTMVTRRIHLQPDRGDIRALLDAPETARVEILGASLE